MLVFDFFDAKVLIADDEVTDYRWIHDALTREGITQVSHVFEPEYVLETARQLNPDLILLDLHMPRRSGLEILQDLKGDLSLCYGVPIIMMTFDSSKEVKRAALMAGATDFVIKGFDSLETVQRIKNHLMLRKLFLEQLRRERYLERAVHRQSLQLDSTYEEMCNRLTLAAEYRDDQTGRHIYRVGLMAEFVAAELGFPRERAELIGMAARLHDIGKIAIPDSVLLKPGRLTAEEMATVQTHAAIGGRLLSGSRSEVLQLAESIAWTHHERWDGRGYPQGLAGKDIPVEGRITAIADVWDALTHERPYKPAWERERALQEVFSLCCKHFDPEVVAAFGRVVEKGDEAWEMQVERTVARVHPQMVLPLDPTFLS